MNLTLNYSANHNYLNIKTIICKGILKREVKIKRDNLEKFPTKIKIRVENEQYSTHVDTP